MSIRKNFAYLVFKYIKSLPKDATVTGASVIKGLKLTKENDEGVRIALVKLARDGEIYLHNPEAKKSRNATRIYGIEPKPIPRLPFVTHPITEFTLWMEKTDLPAYIHHAPEKTRIQNKDF